MTANGAGEQLGLACGFVGLVKEPQIGGEALTGSGEREVETEKVSGGLPDRVEFVLECARQFLVQLSESCLDNAGLVLPPRLSLGDREFRQPCPAGALDLTSRRRAKLTVQEMR